MRISDYLSSNIVICICFFIWPIRELGQKYKNILVQMKTLKFAFEINWPLESGKVLLLIGQPNSKTIYVTFWAFQSKISSGGPESERSRRTPRTHDMLVIKSIPCLQGISYISTT